jgi:nucleoside-diphosphate-sugar epimerase
VQVFIESALAGEKLKIAGDGEERLDFTYIEDLVEGVRRSIVNEKALGEVFNITHGDARSLNDLAAVVRREFPGVGVDYIARDKLMPFRGTLDVSKARAVLGYRPSNPIEVGVPKYAEYYRSSFPKVPVTA